MKRILYTSILVLATSLGVVAQDQESAEMTFNKAAVAYVNGNYETSEEILVSGLQRNPEDKRLMALRLKLENKTGKVIEIKSVKETKKDEQVVKANPVDNTKTKDPKENNKTSENKTETTTTNEEPKETKTTSVDPNDPTQVTISIMKSYGKFSDGSEFDVSSGTKLVCVFSMTCSHCQQVWREMCEISGWGKLPEKYLFNYGEPNEQQFFWNQAGGCTDRHIRFGNENYVDFMRVLEGESFPRILVFKDGKIVKRWDVDSYSKESMMQYFGIEEPKSNGLFDEEPDNNSPFGGSPWD